MHQVLELNQKDSSAGVSSDALEFLHNRPPRERLNQWVVTKSSFIPWPVLVRPHHLKRVADHKNEPCSWEFSQNPLDVHVMRWRFPSPDLAVRRPTAPPLR